MEIWLRGCRKVGGEVVGLRASPRNVLHIFFFPSPTGWWFIFVPEALFSIRTTCDGERLRFYFLSTKKRTKSFSTPYNAYNTYTLPYRVNILLSISSWATASLYTASIWHESTYFHSARSNTSFAYKFFTLIFYILCTLHYTVELLGDPILLLFFPFGRGLYNITIVYTTFSLLWQWVVIVL